MIRLYMSVLLFYQSALALVIRSTKVYILYIIAVVEYDIIICNHPIYHL